MPRRRKKPQSNRLTAKCWPSSSEDDDDGFPRRQRRRIATKPRKQPTVEIVPSSSDSEDDWPYSVTNKKKLNIARQNKCNAPTTTDNALLTDTNDDGDNESAVANTTQGWLAQNLLKEVAMKIRGTATQYLVKYSEKSLKDYQTKQMIPPQSLIVQTRSASQRGCSGGQSYSFGIWRLPGKKRSNVYESNRPKFCSDPTARPTIVIHETVCPRVRALVERFVRKAQCGVTANEFFALEDRQVLRNSKPILPQPPLRLLVETPAAREEQDRTEEISLAEESSLEDNDFPVFNDEENPEDYDGRGNMLESVTEGLSMSHSCQSKQTSAGKEDESCASSSGYSSEFDDDDLGSTPIDSDDIDYSSNKTFAVAPEVPHRGLSEANRERPKRRRSSNTSDKVPHSIVVPTRRMTKKACRRHYGSKSRRMSIEGSFQVEEGQQCQYFALVEGITGGTEEANEGLVPYDYLRNIFVEKNSDALPRRGRIMELPGQARPGKWKSMTTCDGEVPQSHQMSIRSCLKDLEGTRILFRHESAISIEDMSVSRSPNRRFFPATGSDDDQWTDTELFVSRFHPNVNRKRDLISQGIVHKQEFKSHSIAIGSISLLAFDGFATSEEMMMLTKTRASEFLESSHCELKTVDALDMGGLLPILSDDGDARGLQFICKFGVQEAGYHLIIGTRSNEIVAVDVVFDSSTSSDTATPVSACAGDADAHRYRPIPLTAKAREKHTKLTEGAELPSPLQKFLRPHLRGKSDSIFPVEPQQPAMEMADDESRVRARISVVNSIVKGGETRQKKKPTSGKSVTSAPKISKEDMSKCAEISPFLGKENIGVTATPNVANYPTAPIWAKPAPLSCKKWRSKSKTSFVSPTPFASRDKSIQREVLTVGHAHMITPVNVEKPLNRQLMFTPPSIPKPKCTAGAETGGVSLEAHSIERLQSKEEFQDDGLILDDQTDLHDEVRYDGDAGDNDCGGGDFVVSWTGQIIGDEAAVSWATQSTDKQCEETPCTKKRPGSCRSQNLFILIIVAVLFNPTEYQTLLLLPRPTTEYLATASTKLISAICNEQCFDQSQPLFHRSRLVTECLAATWTKSVSTIFNERCFDPSQSLFHRSRLATECLASASTKFISAIFNEHSFDQIGANGGREAADGRKPTFTLVKSNWTLTETITLVPAGLAFLFWLF